MGAIGGRLVASAAPQYVTKEVALKAAAIYQTGPPEVIQYTDMAIPEPKPVRTRNSGSSW